MRACNMPWRFLLLLFSLPWIFLVTHGIAELLMRSLMPPSPWPNFLPCLQLHILLPALRRLLVVLYISHTMSLPFPYHSLTTRLPNLVLPLPEAPCTFFILYVRPTASPQLLNLRFSQNSNLSFLNFKIVPLADQICNKM